MSALIYLYNNEKIKKRRRRRKKELFNETQMHFKTNKQTNINMYKRNATAGIKDVFTKK